MSRPINFTDTIVEKKPYVEINGTEYEVQDGTYNGGTDLNAETFNKMQDELDPFRNLLKIADGRYQSQGVIYEVENGTFRYISGTSDKEVNIAINIPPIKLKAGNYIMTNNSGSYPYLILKSNGNTIARMEYSDNGIKTITINEETIIDSVWVYYGIGHYLPEVKLQLEEGVKETKYTPWVGYIVESGSNDDGSYIKYSDGTMICRYEKEVNVNINIALGSLYRSEGIAFPNFPIAFKKPPIISCYCKGDYSALICNWGKCTQNNPGPQIAIWPVSITSQTYIISYIAVGEWL